MKKDFNGSMGILLLFVIYTLSRLMQSLQFDFHKFNNKSLVLL